MVSSKNENPKSKTCTYKYLFAIQVIFTQLMESSILIKYSPKLNIRYN